MKKSFSILAVVSCVALLMCSCHTYTYTSRSRKVNQRNISEAHLTAQLNVDFTKTVEGTSTTHHSIRAAKKNAEYNAITSNKIDVLVDPIFKVTRSSFNKYMATVIGYAGYFKGTKTDKEIVQEMEDVSVETIEKYKLLNDPSFAPIYYKAKSSNESKNNGSISNSYVSFGTLGYNSSRFGTMSNGMERSLVVEPISNGYDPELAKLLKWGQKEVVIGKSLVSIGVPVFAAGFALSITGFCYGRAYPEIWAPGIVMGIVGGSATVLGGCYWHQGKLDIESVQGEMLTFNYQVAPTGIRLALNF